MKIMIALVSIVLLSAGMSGCSVVNSSQILDNKGNENSVSKKEEVWTHFAN